MELARAGRGSLTPLVSIDGPREMNDALRGPGSYDDVMASVANLLAAGLAPVANTVLVRPALPGLGKLAHELRATGVDRLHLILPHQRVMSAEEADDLLPSNEELLSAVRELLAVAAEIGLTVDNISSWRRRIGKRNDLCAAGCRDLSIDPAGLVHACVITAGDPAFVAARCASSRWRRSGTRRAASGCSAPRVPATGPSASPARRRRVRRRVLGTVALRGAGPRRSRRLRGAVPLLRARPAAARGARGPNGSRAVRHAGRRRLRRLRRLRRPIRSRLRRLRALRLHLRLLSPARA